jgi:hypothetical protein
LKIENQYNRETRTDRAPVDGLHRGTIVRAAALCPSSARSYRRSFARPLVFGCDRDVL